MTGRAVWGGKNGGTLRSKGDPVRPTAAGCVADGGCGARQTVTKLARMGGGRGPVGGADPGEG